MSNSVAGGPFELYSAYPIRVPMVLASVIATGIRVRQEGRDITSSASAAN